MNLKKTMTDEEVIINEGVTSEKIPVHYEVSAYQGGILKRMGGVYSKVVSEHYALFSYCYTPQNVHSFLIEIKDIDFDREELSKILLEYANIFGKSLTKDKENLKIKVNEIREHIKKRNLLELL